MTELPPEHKRAAGMHGRRNAQPVRGAVVQRHAGVEAVGGREAQVGGDVVADEEFAPGAHDGGFGQAGRAGRVDEAFDAVGGDAGAEGGREWGGGGEGEEEVGGVVEGLDLGGVSRETS